MKILVVCQHYWPENFRINDIVDGFIERGHEVDVLCGQPNYPTGEFFKGYDSHTIKEEMHGKVRVYRAFEVKRGSNTNIRIFLNYMTYPYALKISKVGSVEELEGFNKGLFQIQDLSSMLVVELASIKHGDTVLDVCAAPGGKTMHALDVLNGSGCVYAFDISENNLHLNKKKNIDQKALTKSCK